jgi:2-polyprenyl-3-methyl-5-hydroxy-6-metoxy-1,4-benzoquinol methylase
VLDVGCATGLNAEKISKKVYFVNGIDISHVAIEGFIKSGFEGKQCDIVIDGIPYDDNYFDMVFASEVIEHIADTEEFMNELKRVLKPGGRIVLSTPNSSFWVYRVYALIGKTLTDVQHLGHLRFFSKKSLLSCFHNSRYKSFRIKSRKIFIVFPDNVGAILKKIGLGKFLNREFRFKTKEFISYIGKNSNNASNYWSDTLIIVAEN